MLVIVGSKNVAKIKAAEIAFGKIYPRVEIQGIEVESGVDKQPKSDTETIAGARNRAEKAFRKIPKADLAVGMEGGVQKIGKKWYECGWIVVLAKDGRVGIGSSARFELPSKWLKEIASGKEVGQIVDEITGERVGHSPEGAMGYLTKSYLPRSEAYVHGLLFALAPFLSDSKIWEE